MIDHQVNSVLAGKGAPVFFSKQEEARVLGLRTLKRQLNGGQLKHVGRTPFSSNSRLLTAHLSL